MPTLDYYIMGTLDYYIIPTLDCKIISTVRRGPYSLPTHTHTMMLYATIKTTIIAQ